MVRLGPIAVGTRNARPYVERPVVQEGLLAVFHVGSLLGVESDVQLSQSKGGLCDKLVTCESGTLSAYAG